MMLTFIPALNKLVLVLPAFSAGAAGNGLVFAGAQLAPNQGRYVSRIILLNKYMSESDS